MIKKYFIIVLFGISGISANDGDPDGPEVIIQQGRLRGTFWKTRQGREISAFLGIPFAEPPVGALRFKPPFPAKSWKGIRDASKIHGVCPQRNIYTRSEVIEGEEDCLHLNVYTPNVHKDSTQLYPVLVFLHGGGFLCGGGNSKWYAPDILLDKDIVLVVPNYRLGALGFLSTGDEVSPGNNGLKDQNLALKWTKNNVQNFGGDPNKVLLFGESAGGASTHLHMLSPLSQGLFHVGISQSGTALAPWALAPPGEAIKQARKLAKALKCSTSSSKRMLECLSKIDPHKIVAQDRIFMEWDTDPMMPFKPVIEPNIDGAFLVEHPIDAIKAGKSGTIPWITGINTEEGSLRAAAIFGNANLILELDKDFNRIAPISLFYNEEGINKDFISKQIREFYFGDKKIDNSTRVNVIDMYTDAWFLTNADQSVVVHKKYSNNPIYYYLFGNRGVGSLSEQFGDPNQRYGTCHADELQFLFPVGDGIFPDRKADALDQRTSDLITTLWTNLIKYGNPTPKLNSLIHTKWQPVEDIDDLEYYHISGGVHRSKGLLEERSKFWRKLPIHAKAVLRDEL